MEYKVNDREVFLALEALWKDAQKNYASGINLEEKLSVDLDTVVAIINESARFCENELAPINSIGDKQGARLEGSEVHLPKEWKKAYDAFSEAGWVSLSASEKYGGQNLPKILNTVVAEMLHASNMSFGLMPMLSQGVIEVLSDNGTEFQQKLYLEKLISGKYSGTMNLTESQAGSDLRLINTSAVITDGVNFEGNDAAVYKLSGQKIFITYGEHSLTDNIIHLVLAKIKGSNDISLFLVPKILPDGQKNDLQCIKVEEKLGIHASPTCVMSYGESGGAIGFLIGEANQGLNYMFKMMNAARHAVGVEGLSISERAFQAALSYAKDRKQGRSNNPEIKEPISIMHHPDVQRMLLSIESSIFAMRALCYAHALQMDMHKVIEDDESRRSHGEFVELFTPIVKGWCTEIANELTSLSIQIHGGMGYIEETGVAQYYRDARISSIYEGTTGIQAADLVHRKLIRDEGAVMQSNIDEMLDLVDDLEKHAVDTEESMFVIWRKFRDAVDDLERTTEWILENRKNKDIISAIAYDYLMLCGYVFGAWQLNKQALYAYEQKLAKLTDDKLADKFIYLAEFFCCQMLARVMTHENIILRGAGSVSHIVDRIYPK